MNWNLEGLAVTGMYLDTFLVSGKVEMSRVTYGGGVSHHIVLDKVVDVFGQKRDRLILNHKNIISVKQ